MPSAFITGITGQDGSYLAELLLEKGYVVHGMVRRTSVLSRSRIEHLRGGASVYGSRLHLHYADLTDHTTVRRVLIKTKPDELYHLAGQSQPGLSFEIPESTVSESATATLSLLEILRDLDSPPRTYLASSSEVFGSPTSWPQDEVTPFQPSNPYGCAKAFAANLGRVYRDAHGLHICNGIAYNHESPRRGESFVTRKITASVARIAKGSTEVLELGNLESERDWGYAPEYVDAMWRMLQQPEADDYVLATGTRTQVREFAIRAFEVAGIPVVFEGSGKDEIARDRRDGSMRVRINPRFLRPADGTCLVGDASKAARRLAWVPSVRGPALAELMIKSDLAAYAKDGAS
jgi:GDPmannose 4,6-dehydratase